MSLKLLSLKYRNIAFLFFHPKENRYYLTSYRLKHRGPRPVNAVRYNLLWQQQRLSDSAAWKRLQHASITNTLSSFISISCCAGRLGLLPSLDLRAVATKWMELRKGDVAHQPSGIASSQRPSQHPRRATAEQPCTCSGRRTHCEVEWRPLLLST